MKPCGETMVDCTVYYLNSKTHVLRHTFVMRVYGAVAIPSACHWLFCTVYFLHCNTVASGEGDPEQRVLAAEYAL